MLHLPGQRRFPIKLPVDIDVNEEKMVFGRGVRYPGIVRHSLAVDTVLSAINRLHIVAADLGNRLVNGAVVEWLGIFVFLERLAIDFDGHGQTEILDDGHDAQSVADDAQSKLGMRIEGCRCRIRHNAGMVEI